MLRWLLWSIVCGAGIYAQKDRSTWYAPRLGINWGQYRTKDSRDISSRSYWGGGFYGGVALQHSLDMKGKWALQGELGVTQRRSTDRNLLTDWRYNLWSADFAVLGVWRWMRKFDFFFWEAGPSSSLLLYGKYWEKDNLTGEIATRKVSFGQGSNRDIRRGEIALNAGAGAGYLIGPGYLTTGIRVWHGANNLAGGLFKRWQNYGILMTLSYWYDDSLRE
ncbi:MAG: PorT family protein [Bacteroidia bacterium]|nr:PorT family protein [Bacteroidia bacterium]